MNTDPLPTPRLGQSRKRILLTGAEGEVGRRIAPLLARHYDLTCSDLRKTEASPGCFKRADLTNFDEVLQLCTGVESIVHSAIASSRNFSAPGQEEPLNPEQLFRFDNATIDVNVRAVYHLFEAARRQNVKQIVFISSLTTVLRSNLDILPPNPAPAPTNLYACTKLFGENLGKIYAEDYGISVICLRLGQPYPQNIPQESTWLADKRSRSFFVAYEDIARAVDGALRHPDIGYGVFSIVSKGAIEVIDLTTARQIGYVPGFSCDKHGAWQAVDTEEAGLLPDPHPISAQNALKHG